jgi:hypothetical protein
VITNCVGSDICDADVATVSDAAAGYALGSHTYSCAGQDDSGNIGSASCRVDVVDTTPPHVTCNDVTVECTGALTSVPAGCTGSDLCDPNVTVSSTAVSAYSVGLHPYSCSAQDSSGNTASAACQVRVVDTVAPVFDSASLGARTLIGDCTGHTLSFPLPTATDVCQGSVNVSCTALPGNRFGTNVVACTATDASGNVARASLMVNVLQPLHVMFQPPLADDNVADNIDTDADIANVFQVKSTIPNQVKLFDCGGADVTSTAAVSVKIGVTKRSGSVSAAGTVVLPTYTGAGDVGSTMVLVDGMYKYNLKTTGYDSGTFSNTNFYDSVVSVSYSATPSLVVGQEDARLESK